MRVVFSIHHLGGPDFEVCGILGNRTYRNTHASRARFKYLMEWKAFCKQFPTTEQAEKAALDAYYAARHSQNDPLGDPFESE